MSFNTRTSASSLSKKLDDCLGYARASVLRMILAILVGCLITYFLFLPVLWLFKAWSNASRPTPYQFLVHEPGEDVIKHFAGSSDCGISQGNIYVAPWPTSPKVSPFCKNRATLLEALSGGGRHGFDEPYVGKGCTYKWFPTAEVCMVLERFNAILFVGDDIAQSIYAAFNILLREDLALGSLQQWLMTDEERTKCKCDNQFINSECQVYAIKNRDYLKKNEVGDRRGNPYFCERVPHTYIPVNNIPASQASQTLFQDMVFAKPNPWQPNPIIFSLGHLSSFDVTTTTRALDEWTDLSIAAERNVPMLFLGPPAFGLHKSATTKPENGNLAVWQYIEEMTPIAKEKHFDVLSLYNLTVQASSTDGEHFGENVALVEAMMILNWLSKLETS